jgi:hypothetical protein
MDATFGILIIATIISGNLFQYMLNSRCSEVDCWGCHFKRDVVSEARMNDSFATASANQQPAQAAAKEGKPTQL